MGYERTRNPANAFACFTLSDILSSDDGSLFNLVQ